jgi:tetratricopeptide (TPR) repeat protein
MQSNTAAIVRWEAQRLAAAGERESALDLLDHLGGEAGAEGAILRGKILGQQGRFARAASSFREALEAAPGNEVAKQGLALAEKLARSPLARLRLRSRPLLAALLALAALGALGWRATQAWGQSNRELAAAVAALDRGMQESGTGLRESADAVRERIGRLESALQAQGQASDKANEQVRGQLRHMQAQLAGTVTEEQLRSTRAEMLESLKRLESTLGQTPRH